MKEAVLNPNDKNCGGYLMQMTFLKFIFYLKDAENISQEKDYKLSIKKMIKRLNSCLDEAKLFFKLIKYEEKTISFF